MVLKDLCKLEQPRRADYSGVVSENCGADLGSDLRIAVIVVSVDKLSYGSKKSLLLVAYSSADAHKLGLENVDDIYYADGNIANIVIHDLFAGLVVFTHGVKGGASVDSRLPAIFHMTDSG